MRSVVNRIRGQVRIRVECAFPERVLNLCGARELSFWDLEWESPTVFTCRLSRKDYRALRRMAEKLDCVLTAVEKEGAPFFLLRFRHRQALLTGLLICGFGLFLGSFFVWDFQVEGNETVPTARILRSLERHGVGIGSFGLSLDGADLRNRVLLDIPELSWISVNVSGCQAQVQVRERIPMPEMINEQSPANVTARRSGLVLEVHAMDGVAAVLPGTSVTEGQLLISGIEDLDTFGARVMAGMGKVTARTWYTLSTDISLTGQEKQDTGKEKTGYALIFGKHRVKFFSNSSIEAAGYDKITDRIPFSLLGVALPVTLVRETYRFYETDSVSLDPAQAERLGEEILTEQLDAMIAAYGTVSSAFCSSRQRDGVLTVTLWAECVEEIGTTVPIILNS